METKQVTEEKVKAESKDEINCEHDAVEHIVEDQHEGTVVCSKCGVVIVEQVICGIAEWRTFADDNQTDGWDRSRVGGPANRFLSGGANLSTTIRAADGSRHTVSSRHDANSFNSSILRAVKRKSVDNGIFHGLKQLDEMADRIHLTQSVLEYAHYLYYKMYKKGKFKGIALATDAKVGACLYIACYHAQCPRTVNEICGISENGHQSIRNAIHRITKMLNLPVGPIECRDVLPRFCAWLSLPHHIQREAITVADTLSKFDDRQQFEVEVLSAAAIYFVTQQSTTLSYRRSKTEIADSLGIATEDVSFCFEYFQQK